MMFNVFKTAPELKIKDRPRIETVYNNYNCMFIKMDK